jgi:protein-L-isoaspartate(D-aspartate) O-methyltransferase
MNSEKELLIKKWIEDNLIQDEKIISAFREIPREDFLEKQFKKHAYIDLALPSKLGQTISQPTTIAIMLKALELKKTDIVLEIGAGTGYSSALMSKIAKKIYSVEIIPELCEYAKNNLKKHNIDNVEIICSDGTLGLPEKAPFDKIVATAAIPQIPESWFGQLKEDGIIVAPIGVKYSQEMVKAKKIKGKGNYETLGAFVFVPAKGKYGFNDENNL